MTNIINLSNKKHFSDRDKILRKVFKMFVNKNLYVDEEYHAFCRWAKGKSESMLISHLNKE